MNKLEFLSVSYTTLKSIGAGAFSQLPSLKTLMITNNPHLSIIHPSALSRKGKEDPRRIEYPPLTNVKILCCTSVDNFLIIFEIAVILA